ncbi:MAG: hypothetical protein V4615_12585 [Bacteroidota bacterium]
MKTLTLFLLLTILVCSGCKKLIDINENYIGEWRGGVCSSFGGMNYFLTIYEDGSADYDRDGTFYGYGHERWSGTLKSNGKRFHIGRSSPWFIIIEDPIRTDEDVSRCFLHDDSAGNWRMKFKYPKTIGYDGAEVTMYRDK